MGFGDPAIEAIRAVYRVICQQEVLDDGLVFDNEEVVEAVRDDQQYRGIRVRSRAFLGRTRIPIQIDIGFGDAITPAPSDIEFPSLLNPDGPHLKAYPRETVVAEKFQAIVELGLANSRMKDFYDLVTIARLFSFDGSILAAAMRATFDRRRTPLPFTSPIALGPIFSSDPTKNEQWSTFVRRTPLLIEVRNLSVVVDEIAAFVMPPSAAASAGEDFAMTWNAGGSWSAIR